MGAGALAQLAMQHIVATSNPSDGAFTMTEASPPWSRHTRTLEMGKARGRLHHPARTHCMGTRPPRAVILAGVVVILLGTGARKEDHVCGAAGSAAADALCECETPAMAN